MSFSFLHPPTALSYPGASSCSPSFLHHRFCFPGGCCSGHFCTYLVSQRQAGVGIPIRLLKLDNGDEPRLGVLILAGVAQGQRVGLRDKSKGRLRSWGSARQRRASPPPQHPAALSECQRGSEHHKEQITVKVVVHQDNVPEKGGVSTFLVAALGSDCPRHSHAKPGQPVRPQPLTSGSEHPYGTGPGAASTASLLRPRDS